MTTKSAKADERPENEPSAQAKLEAQIQGRVPPHDLDA